MFNDREVCLNFPRFVSSFVSCRDGKPNNRRLRCLTFGVTNNNAVLVLLDLLSVENRRRLKPQKPSLNYYLKRNKAQTWIRRTAFIRALQKQCSQTYHMVPICTNRCLCVCVSVCVYVCIWFSFPYAFIPCKSASQRWSGDISMFFSLDSVTVLVYWIIPTLLGTEPLCQWHTVNTHPLRTLHVLLLNSVHVSAWSRHVCEACPPVKTVCVWGGGVMWQGGKHSVR